ncbi:TerB N-terminal domain-containing protein [Psychrobacter sp. 5A.1]|uniref:tellurite resistance TerB family protein n=1 Tax=Psychrobacter sp. 5A.1 TaxID=3035207 RepID=UPI0025B2FF9A|nr:TerB N-terminal domain-containing protein [Psychrobacter sp. 5A.1]MDN3502161.1 TerB N-terminal domain-containing protein [Psychrobacter sp. 5A.1]
MKNFIADVKALFRQKYDADAQGNKTTKPAFIDLPPDIKPDNRHRVSQSSQNDDTDDFASFIISSGKSNNASGVSANKQLGRWFKENEAFNIKGRSIERGFHYVGGQLTMLTGFGIEPSLVDDSLPASSPNVIHSISPIYHDESLGYWPSYERLSVKCRGTYLDWLASNRAHPSTPIGYVFIYFGGFERRIIEHINDDVVSDAEFMAIYEEVTRLNRIYGSQSASFDSYSAHFLAFMTLIRSLLFEDKAQTGDLLPPPFTSQNLKFKMHLAKTVALQLPIPASLAWEWLVYSNEYNFKTPAKRCEAVFKSLFAILYQDIYQNGFVVSANKTRLKLSYNAASRSIVSVELTLDDLPDPSILRAPVKKIITIAEQCNDALDAYSRYLGKEDSSADDIAAIMLLPKTLIYQQDYLNDNPTIRKFKTWAQSIIKHNEGLTTTKELWAYLDEPLPQTSSKTLSKKQNELIIHLVELAGFGIAPDQRYHQTRLQSDGYAVLFAGGHGAHCEDFEPSSSFYQVSLAMRLGAMVATINGYVDKREVDTLLTLLNQDSQLTTIEKGSLTAYLLWQLNTPANMAGLKATLADLDDQYIGFISRFIITVALANGNIEPSQIKQIEKLYQALGLDRTMVTSDIHQLTTNKKVNMGINNAPETKDNSDKNSRSFSFDAELLALHERETAVAKAMLSKIFAVEDEESEDDIKESVLLKISSKTVTEHQSNVPVNNHSSGNEVIINGLDSSHSQLYQELISAEVWQREAVNELCESLNLMINGAIETINDWAYDKVDAPVLEDDDEMVVDFEIVDELKALNS